MPLPPAPRRAAARPGIAPVRAATTPAPGFALPPAARPAPRPEPLRGGGRASLRQGTEIEHRVQQRTRLAQIGQPAIEDRIDFATAVEIDQTAVDREPEI